jgi:hypothetical protein
VLGIPVRSDGIITKLERCLGFNLAPDQSPEQPEKPPNTIIKYFPLDPFGPLPVVHVENIIFLGHQVPVQIHDKYLEITSKMLVSSNPERSVS